MPERVGDQGEENSSPDFDQVEETEGDTEYEEIREEVELAFPEDTIAFEELVDDGGAVTESESAEARNETGDETRSREDVDERTEAGTSSGASSTGKDTIVAQLAAELEAERPSEQAVASLRQELGVTAPQNVEVRLRHLQTQVCDLTAYVDALEEFLDERGGARRVLASVESDLESLETRLDELERTHDTAHAELQERLTTVEADVAEYATLREELGELRERTDDLAKQLSSSDETVETVADRVHQLEDDVTSALETVDQRQATLQAEVETIRQTHQQLARVFAAGDGD